MHQIAAPEASLLGLVERKASSRMVIWGLSAPLFAAALARAVTRAVTGLPSVPM